MSERWPGLLSRAEAAEYLGVSIETVSREKAGGKIKSVCIRVMIKYRREDLDQYIRDLPEGDGEFHGAATMERRRAKERNSKRVSPRKQPAA